MDNLGHSTANSFTPVIRAHASSYDAHPDSYACPICGARDLIRIRRRFIDRIVSLFVRQRRFRCTHSGCQWAGNLRGRKN